MTDDDLIVECKKGLDISLDSNVFDDVLRQKILVVKAFMKNAGVVDSCLINDLGVGVIVMGVGDLWEIHGGEVKFSPAFMTLLGQLTYDDGVTP